MYLISSSTSRIVITELPILNGEFTVFWLGISVVYLILSYRNWKTLQTIDRAEDDENGNVSISPGGISVGGSSSNPNSIILTKMFKSILRTDLVALLVGLFAALLSILSSL